MTTFWKSLQSSFEVSAMTWISFYCEKQQCNKSFETFMQQNSTFTAKRTGKAKNTALAQTHEEAISYSSLCEVKKSIFDVGKVLFPHQMTQARDDNDSESK